jgi:hypothetical protein
MELMKIGLISDTHDNIGNILNAVKQFNDRNTDVVLHAGDFVSPLSVESFNGVKLIGVLGNNDTNIPGLTSAFKKIHGELKGEFFESVYDGMKFAVYHGTSSAQRELLIKSGKYDVVIYGHTHRKVRNNYGRTLVINPGTAKGWIFGFNATASVFDTQNGNLEFINL